MVNKYKIIKKGFQKCPVCEEFKLERYIPYHYICLNCKTEFKRITEEERIEEIKELFK